MTDDNFVPENSDQHNPPDSLAQTTFECGHCGDEFADHADLAEHAIDCGDSDG